MFAKNRIFAVLALLMLPAMTCQAAWMRQEGEIGASIGVTVSDIGEFFDRAGNRVRNTCGGALDMPMQVEYGASYYRTYYASTSLSAYNCGLGQVSGLTDVELGMRGRMNLTTSDHIWELAAIIPNYVDPMGAARQPKDFGVKFGLHSSNRIDPYQSFMAGDPSSLLGQSNVISYGAGVKMWVGHIPNELSGYMGWAHTLFNSAWKEDIGGWYFSARLDGSTSFGKEHNFNPGPGIFPTTGVRDVHDHYSLVTGHVGLSHSLTEHSSVQFSLKHGLWGRNMGSPSGVYVGYSKVWRD